MVKLCPPPPHTYKDVEVLGLEILSLELNLTQHACVLIKEEIWTH